MADKHKSVENHSSPQITMRVEGPPEDSKTEASENSKPDPTKEDDELKLCTPSRTTPHSTTNPFAAPHTIPSTRGILKPPQLSLNNTNSKPAFVLSPSRLNPGASTANNSKDAKGSQVNGETPKFVPLIQSEPKSVAATPATTATTLASNSFVFGQNLQARVVNSDGKVEEPKPSTSLNSNGTTEMLFSSAIKSEGRAEGVGGKETKSLSESAREYEESRAVKRKYEEVEVITGEEDELNILNIHCKLFAFDKASGSWQERGRGVLRVNDFCVEGHTQSRLLFRTTGIWRVILNTKIWAEMTVEQASEKSVRFTAMDTQGVIKVFLVMASIEDSKQLFSSIQVRVQKEVAAQKHKKLSVEPDSGGN